MWVFVILFLFIPTIGEACTLYHNVAIDRSGNVVADASVDVNVAGTTTNATIYADVNCTVVEDNPFTTEIDGTFQFYVEDGLYDITLTKTNYTFPSLLNVPVFDPMGQNVRLLGEFTTTDITTSAVGALPKIGASTRTLVINKPATAATTYTCPSNVTLLFIGSGTLTTTVTLTMNCRVVNLTDHAVLLTSGSGAYTFSPTSVRTKHFWFPASTLTSDGTQCANAARVTLNSGPAIHTIICADNDASSIYGSLRMPDSWDGGTVTFTMTYTQTAVNTNALHSDITAQCRGNTETVSSTWGTEVPMDDAAVTGSAAVDILTSAAVTPAGSCAGGDMLWFRWQLDAAGTTTAVATLNILGFDLVYNLSPNTPMTE